MKVQNENYTWLIFRCFLASLIISLEKPLRKFSGLKAGKERHFVTST